MAEICACCGKKINVFLDGKYEFNNGKTLCGKCAEPVMGRISFLSYTDNEEKFLEAKENILSICNNKFDESITEIIRREIDERYQAKENVWKENRLEKIRKENITNHMLTTGYDFDGYNIKKYLGVISGQVVLGTGFLSEVSATVADMLGETSEKFASKLEQAKNAALKKMIEKSVSMGSNAIIGVDFDYITFRNNLIGVVANGTSVIVEKKVTEQTD